MLCEIKKTRTSSNLFEIKSIFASEKNIKKALCKLGARKIYVDFPKIAYLIQQINFGDLQQ